MGNKKTNKVGNNETTKILAATLKKVACAHKDGKSIADALLMMSDELLNSIDKPVVEPMSNEQRSVESDLPAENDIPES